MKQITYTVTVLIWLICLATISFAQKRTIDSLQTVVENSQADTNKVKNLNALAFALRISDLSAAEKYRKEALKLSLSLKYTSGIAWAHYLEGVIYTYQNMLMKSVNSLTIALDLAGKAGDYALMTRIHNGIGLTNLRLEDDYTAMKAFETALQTIKKSPDKSFKSALLHNIGSLYVKNKRFKEAIKTLAQSITINTGRNNKTGLALNYKEMGLAYYGLEDYPAALIYGNKALALSDETDFSLNKINSHSLLGMTYLKLGSPDKAKFNLDAAFKEAIPNNPQREKLLIYRGYADYYSAQRNFKAALKFQNQYAALFDSLYSVGRAKLILGYQGRFQVQQKEAENKSLRNEQLITTNQIEVRNQLLISISVILLAFIIVSALVYWGNTRIKLANALLREQRNEIELQKDSVEHLNTIKDKLFSVIAHDLRTPFASLKNMMDMYDEGMISKQDISYFFKEIRKDIGSNTMLLENLLIWAKSQLDGFKVETKNLAMQRVVNEIIYLYRQNFESKQIKVLNELDDLCIVASDYEMTKTIVRNLIGNALKFTPANGNIVISYRKVREGELQITVTDDGIGMSEELKGKLFLDAFVSTQGLNNERGTGLGLQICKEFVEKNGGSIWVETLEQQGSSFWFTLPESKVDIENTVSDYDIEEEKKESLNEMINVARLKSKYDRYELLLKTCSDTIWDWNLVTDEIIWNEALQHNFGYALEKTTVGWWSGKLHPEHLEPVSEQLESAIRNGERLFELEYPFRCADNSYKYVLDRGLILYEDGKACRVLGIMHNTDNSKNAIREIRRLSLVATNVNNLVVITDADSGIVWVNQAFETLTGYKSNEVIGKDLNSLLSGPDTATDALEFAVESMANRESFETELINYGKSGQAYWVHINCTPFKDPVSGQMGNISIHTIVNERKMNEKQMIEQNLALREIARIASHEVRSPLCSIMGLTRIIRNNPDPAELRECISMLEESADQLHALIGRINDHLSEIDQTEFQDV